jgi:hypothetical protein
MLYFLLCPQSITRVQAAAAFRARSFPLFLIRFALSLRTKEVSSVRIRKRGRKRLLRRSNGSSLRTTRGYSEDIIDPHHRSTMSFFSRFKSSTAKSAATPSPPGDAAGRTVSSRDNAKKPILLRAHTLGINDLAGDTKYVPSICSLDNQT